MVQLCVQWRFIDSEFYPVPLTWLWNIFYVLVTLYLHIIPIKNQHDEQFLLYIFIYFDSVHVSSNFVLFIRRFNCINTTSGICHSV